IEPREVGQTAGCLQGHQEAIRQPIVPAGEGGVAWPVVITAVELDRVEPGDVEIQPLREGRAGRIQHALPVIVAPAGSADPDQASAGGKQCRQMATWYSNCRSACSPLTRASAGLLARAASTNRRTEARMKSSPTHSAGGAHRA